MSLRLTLILGIALVLTTSLLCGSVVLYWHAVSKVDIEVDAALAVSTRTLLDGVSMRSAGTQRQDFAGLVGSLDGDRHVRATLLAPEGTVLARSTPLLADPPAPSWFYRLLARPPRVTRIVMPPGAAFGHAILIQTDAHNEIGEAWSDATLTFAILVLFCSLNSLSIYWVVGHSLKPLDALIAAFHRVGAGDYELTAAERGPAELAQLARHFNRMVARLAGMLRRKARLEEQLVAVQDEERAELARDLHDEIGPLLFALGVDMMALQAHEAIRADPPVHARLAAAGEAVSRMQQQVRSILGRLRPATGVNLGLQSTFERLFAFWSLRYPSVSFDLEIDEEHLGAPVAAQVHRIVQESVANALRHGHPTRITLCVRRDADASLLVEVIDDREGLVPAGLRGGLGITGMRDWVQALGGTLEVHPADTERRGVRVQARLPGSLPKNLPADAAHQEPP